ncbi:MAG: hypothetical protein F6J95_021770 [Leptolyngbya sp. SIO1E4]|nr:hypothetical protein [Leptolyngbya sp. SIO1E4]
MESASSSEHPPEPPSPWFAPVIGTVVAFLTLTLPLLAIAHYSSANIPMPSLPTYPLSQTRE